MKWKSRLTNYNFWVSMVSAVLLVLQAFDLKFDIAHLNEIVTAILGLLVVIGIINDPTKTANSKTSNLADNGQQKENAINQTDEIVDEQNNANYSNDFTPHHMDEAEITHENDSQIVCPQIENDMQFNADHKNDLVTTENDKIVAFEQTNVDNL